MPHTLSLDHVTWRIGREFLLAPSVTQLATLCPATQRE
jgi:hypothetical protein